MSSLKHLNFTFLVLVLCSCNNPKDVKTRNGIPWNKNIKPTWNDFLGQIPWDNKHKAATYYYYSSKDSLSGDSLQLEVLNYFWKDSSWVATYYESDYLLNHELRHFDLAEINIRRFREYLQDWKDTNSASFDIYFSYARSFFTYDSSQKQYDTETDHSRNKIEQEKWNKKIDSLLNVLKEYEQPIFRIKKPKNYGKNAY